MTPDRFDAIPAPPFSVMEELSTVRPPPNAVAIPAPAFPVTFVRVSDTGCGICDDFMPELFDAFAQAVASIRRNHSGVGLGLAMASRQVRRLGGRIEVDSRPGEGSTFTLHLPLVRAADAVEPAPSVAPSALPAPPSAPDQAEDRAPRVLVVDDHPVNREVARIMLEAAGCEVVEVCDGVEALEAASTAAFDLVLMDVRMPRMDGLEFATRSGVMTGFRTCR